MSELPPQEESETIQDPRTLRLKLATDALGVGVFEVVDGVPVWENDCMYSIFGRDKAKGPIYPDEFQASVLHPDDAPGLNSAFEAAIEEGRTLTVPCRIKRQSDGQWRQIEFTAHPSKATDGQVRVVGVVADVTDRHRAHQLLTESEERYRHLFEGMPVAAVVARSDGSLHSFNQAAHEVFGYQRSEFAQIKLTELIAEPEPSELLSRIHLAVSTQGKRSFESRYQHADGHLIDVHVEAQAVTVDGSRCALGILTDLTERKRAERTRQLHAARLDVALEAGSMAAWQWDVGSGTAMWSDGLYRLTGVPKGNGHEPIQRFLDLVYEDDRALVERNSAAMTQQGDFPTIEHRIRRADDGAVRWILANGRALFDESGKVSTIVGVNTDITERKMMEVALRETDRRKDEFLAILSHELRNPLAPITTAVSALKKGVPEATAAKMLDIVGRQAHQLTHLVNDLLDVSRVTTGRIVLQPSISLIQDVIDSAVEAVTPILQRKSQRLRVEHHGQASPLFADVTRLTQVVVNLLHNASKFSGEGDRIDLLVEEAEDVVKLTVIDQGCGIEPEAVTQIFDLFSQGRSAARSSERGLGIGLALAKGLVSLHGGTIHAESAGVGQGACFEVLLPRKAAPSPAMPAESDPRAPSTTPRRVLIVDDNKDAAESLAVALQGLGHAVQVSYTGAACMEELRHTQPDIVFLDLGMPGMDGFEVASAIQEIRPGMACVALSGFASEADKARTAACGFVGHLSKPAPMAEVMRMIDLAGSRP